MSAFFDLTNSNWAMACSILDGIASVTTTWSSVNLGTRKKLFKSQSANQGNPVGLARLAHNVAHLNMQAKLTVLECIGLIVSEVGGVQCLHTLPKLPWARSDLPSRRALQVF
jgi:hypothetical protein